MGFKGHSGPLFGHTPFSGESDAYVCKVFLNILAIRFNEIVYCEWFMLELITISCIINE